MTDRYPATDGDVVIIGSLNADLVVRTQRHPEPGETVYVRIRPGLEHIFSAATGKRLPA